MKTLQIKSLAFIFVLLLMGGTALAQFAKVDIPKIVSTNFTVKYPQAQLKKWKIIKDTCIAMFVMDNQKYTATYTQKGSWVSTELEYKRLSNMPTAIQSYLKTSGYASWHIDKLFRLTTSKNSQYIIQLDNHGGGNGTLASEGVGLESSKTLFFDTDGNLVNSTDSMFSF